MDSKDDGMSDLTIYTGPDSVSLYQTFVSIIISQDLLIGSETPGAYNIPFILIRSYDCDIVIGHSVTEGFPQKCGYFVSDITLTAIRYPDAYTFAFLFSGDNRRNNLVFQQARKVWVGEEAARRR
jgi:hypothetical protein